MTTYLLQISEAQRAILEAAMRRFPKTEEEEMDLFKMLRDLPKSESPIN